MSMLIALALLATAVLSSPLWDRQLGRDAGWPLAALYLGSFAALLPSAREVLDGRNPTWSTPWLPDWGVSFALRADGLGLVFASIALLIGAAVFVYSTRYLGSGSQLSFYLVMTTFTLAMVGLVLADDLLLLFVCWELTSLASFLLIARSGHSGEAASMRTLLITFLGGLCLLAAVALVVVNMGTTSLTEIMAHPLWREDPTFTAAAALLILIAGCTKSAQFPFHVWLPDAMAAITPVSAYLHAAAVVKAGIFLLMRFTPVFHATPAWTYTLVTTGLVTSALGAWFALQQRDLKKLMAYSTVSQLGLIVATVGVGTATALAAAVVHTIAHALFKSGLFMMVGVVDHATHTRDLRRLPPLWRVMPGAFTVTALGCASMAGIPPMLGFVSKESLFGGLLGLHGPAWFGPTALVLAAGSSVLTFAYCTKILFGAFVDGRDDREVHPVQARLTVSAGLPIVAGLPLGLVSGLLDLPVTRAAQAARPGTTYASHLTLWHGVTPELLATLAVFTLGGVILARRRRIWPRLERQTLPVDGAAVISSLHAALSWCGVRLARPVEVDHPSRHLGLLVCAFVAVVLGGAASLDWQQVPALAAGQNRTADIIVFVLISAAVLMVCRSDSRLAATVSLSGVGILATVQILALGAPDVALTQLLVESLTVIVIMLVLQKLPAVFGRTSERRRRRRVLALAVAAGASAGLVTFLLSGRRDRSAIAEYYIDQGTPVTGGQNIVNVILVEFRALDTMGELTVLGMAGVAIVAVLSSIRHRQLDPSGQEDRTRVEMPAPQLREPGTAAYRAIHEAWPNVVPVQLMLRFVVPVLLTLSALIFWRGHNAPGGGFIAALVGSAVVGMIYLSTSRDRQIGPPRLPLLLIGGGILTAAITGLWGLAAAGSFLEPLRGHLGHTHLSSAMLFDAGVYAAVLGLVMVAFNLLGTSSESTGHPGGEGTRERTDEIVEGELPGPLDTVRGKRPRVGVRSSHLADNTRPGEVGR